MKKQITKHTTIVREKISILEYKKVHWWIHYYFGSANKCENRFCKKKSTYFTWALKRGKKYSKNRKKIP
jgi:hypothetical protein